MQDGQDHHENVAASFHQSIHLSNISWFPARCPIFYICQWLTEIRFPEFPSLRNSLVEERNQYAHDSTQNHVRGPSNQTYGSGKDSWKKTLLPWFYGECRYSKSLQADFLHFLSKLFLLFFKVNQYYFLKK